MAREIKGKTPFEVGGESLFLLLDFNALCDLEGAVPGLMDGTAEIKSPRAIRAGFAAGLQECKPGIDDRGAGQIIHAIGLEKAGELVSAAFEASFGKAAASGPQKARPSDGAGSAP
jgi:hypothetical protein